MSLSLLAGRVATGCVHLITHTMARQINKHRVQRAIASLAICVGFKPFAAVSYRYVRHYLCRYECAVTLLLIWVLAWLYLHSRKPSTYNQVNQNAPHQNVANQLPQYNDFDDPDQPIQKPAPSDFGNNYFAKTQWITGGVLGKAPYARRITYSNSTAGTSFSTRYSSTVDFAYFASKGNRPHMEDRVDYISDGKSSALYCLYDGHGGTYVSNILETELGVSIWNRIFGGNSSLPDWHSTFTEEILRIDKRILEGPPSLPGTEGPTYTGSTLLAAVVYKNRYLAVANVGDCRAVLCDSNGQATNITSDHKPHSQSEKSRIESSGGFIAFNGVWRVAGTLAVSRALGDGYLKFNPPMLTAQPDVFVTDLAHQRSQFMIMASDGLWDVVSAQEAVDLVLRSSKIRRSQSTASFSSTYSSQSTNSDPWLDSAQELVNLALRKGSMDNISVMIVNLNQTNRSRR